MSAVERALTVTYLEVIGRRLDSVFVPPLGAPLSFAAYARLYDPSDPGRLARITAETYQFQDLVVPQPDQHWGCFGPAGGNE